MATRLVYLKMARIVTCRCAVEFYDSTGTATLCNGCKRTEAEKAKRRERAVRHIARLKKGTYFSINFAFIQLYWRYRLPLWECAKLLGISEDQARFERDISRQNAR